MKLSELRPQSKNKQELRWTIGEIKDLDTNAFNNANSIFYSCNTGTPIENGTSFAQEWSNITGGKTVAAVGQTTYRHINAFDIRREGSRMLYKKLRESVGGYSVPFPAFRRPVLGSGARWKTFKPKPQN